MKEYKVESKFMPGALGLTAKDMRYQVFSRTPREGDPWPFGAGWQLVAESKKRQDADTIVKALQIQDEYARVQATLEEDITLLVSRATSGKDLDANTAMACGDRLREFVRWWEKI